MMQEISTFSVESNRDANSEFGITVNIEIACISACFGTRGETYNLLDRIQTVSSDPLLLFSSSFLVELMENLSVDTQIFIDQDFICILGYDAKLSLNFRNQLLNLELALQRLSMKEYSTDHLQECEIADLQRKGRELVTSSVEKNKTELFKLSVVAKLFGDSNFGTNIKVALNLDSLQVNAFADSVVYLKLPNYFTPPTLFMLKERCYHDIFRIVDRFEKEIKFLPNADSKMQILLQRLLESRNVYTTKLLSYPAESLRLLIELQNTRFSLPLNDETVLLSAEKIFISLTLLSNLKSFTMKVSTEGLSLAYCEPLSRMSQTLSKIDTFSILATTLNYVEDIQVVELTFGKLTFSFAMEVFLIFQVNTKLLSCYSIISE
jgi:hypothetical protein